jgi:HEAT repeat protein
MQTIDPDMELSGAIKPQQPEDIVLNLLGANYTASAVAGLLGDPSPEVQGAACIALGNLGAADKAADVAKKLDSESTKYAAVSALSAMGETAVAPYVSKIIECLGAADLPTRGEALGALMKVAPAELSKISSMTSSKSVPTRAAAALALGNWGEGASSEAKAVAALLKDGEEDLSWLPLQIGGGAMRAPMALRKPRCAALVALGNMKGSVSDITEALSESDWEVRFCALEGLAALGEAAKESAGKISDLLDDETYPVRGKACSALGAMKAEDQVDKLSEMLDDKAQCVRAEAATALSAMGEAAYQYSGEICKLLSDSSNNVRAAAVTALAALGEGGKPYASVVAGLLYDPMPDVRAATALALGNMGQHGAAFQEDVGVLIADSDPSVAAAASEAMSLMDAYSPGALGDMTGE